MESSFVYLDLVNPANKLALAFVGQFLGLGGEAGARYCSISSANDHRQQQLSKTQKGETGMMYNVDEGNDERLSHQRKNDNR